MIEKSGSKTGAFDISKVEEGAFVLRFYGKMTAENGGGILKRLEPAMDALLGSDAPRHLKVDIRDVSYMDDFGALAVSRAMGMAASRNVTVEMAHAGGRFMDMIACFGQTRRKNLGPGEKEGLGWGKEQPFLCDKKRSPAPARIIPMPFLFRLSIR